MTQQVSVLEPSHRSRHRALSGGNAFASSPRTDAMRFNADIPTDRLKLTLVRAGKVSLHVSVTLYDFVLIMETASIDDWLWQVTTRSGHIIGTIGLRPAQFGEDRYGVFGPRLKVFLVRSEESYGYGADAIMALANWISDCGICHVLHADHCAADSVLAAWLVDAGFLYTGCHDIEHGFDWDSPRQMIMLL